MGLRPVAHVQLVTSPGTDVGAERLEVEAVGDVTGDRENLLLEGRSLTAPVNGRADTEAGEQVISTEHGTDASAVSQVVEAGETDVEVVDRSGRNDYCGLEVFFFDRRQVDFRCGGRSRNFDYLTGCTRLTSGTTGAFRTLRTDGAGLTLGTLRSRRANQFAGVDGSAEAVELRLQCSDLGAQLVEFEGGVLLGSISAGSEGIDVSAKLIDDTAQRGHVFLGQNDGGLGVLGKHLEQTLDDECRLVTGE